MEALTCEITIIGPIFNNMLNPLIQNAILNATSKLTEDIKSFAQADYLSKRKAKGSSLVFQSFSYGTSPIVLGAVGHVIAGGVTAPWAIYVDQPRSFRGGKGEFPGYFFMREATKYGQEVAESYFKKEFKKLGCI